MSGDLTFRQVTKANVARCDRWHDGGLNDWSVSDWAVAMAGEAGEVCNAVKKLRRVEDEISNISDPDRQLSTRQEAAGKIGEELADTFLYPEPAGRSAWDRPARRSNRQVQRDI